MSDVVNMRKQITRNAQGATIHDWLEEKGDEIDLETFECFDFLKILSQLCFKMGQLASVDMFGDEIWARTKADSFFMFFPLSSESDPGDLSLSMCPQVQCSKEEDLLGNVVGVKLWESLSIRVVSDQAEGSAKGRGLSNIRGFTYVAGCVWWNKWDNSQQAVRALANKW